MTNLRFLGLILCTLAQLSGGPSCEATTVTDNLIQLTKLRFVNAYLVRESDGFTLVDTTMGKSADALIAAAREAGAPIRRIALTHGHGDHVGALDELKGKLGDEVQVLMPELDARIHAGEKVVEGKLTGSWPKLTTVPDVRLMAGDRVGSLEVVPSPGHTPGHVAFLDTRDRALIAGRRVRHDRRGGGLQPSLLAVPAAGHGHLRQAAGPGLGQGAAGARSHDPGRRPRSGDPQPGSGDGPGDPAGRRLMPRAGLDSDAVVAAAAALADAEGLERLTLARLAQQLGVRSPSLYAHVDGLEDLRTRLAIRGARQLRGRAAGGRRRPGAR